MTDDRGGSAWRPAGELEHGLTPGVIDGYAERTFTQGGCGALAIAMHDALRWPIIAITDAHNVHDGRAGGGSAMHWGVLHPNGLFVDVDGAHDLDVITGNYAGDADDGESAWGLSTRADAEEWWNEGGRKVSLTTAGMFVQPLIDRLHEHAGRDMEGNES